MSTSTKKGTAGARPTRLHTNHYVDFGYGQESESVSLYYETTWRSRPVVATMTAKRTRHRQSWSAWSIYVEEAREDDGERYENGLPSRRGARLTDLAHARLREPLRAEVESYLRSSDYAIGRSRAYFDAIRREVREARYGDPPSASARRLLDVHGRKLTDSQSQLLEEMCDALDAFVAKLDEVPS